jgi:hypothetical protein
VKILTQTEFNAAVNDAFVRGYKAGYEQAERDAVFRKTTINDIRAALGLPKLPTEEGAK